MTYEEFIDEIKTMFVADDYSGQFKIKDRRPKENKKPRSYSYYDNTEEYERPRLYVEWETGGYIGGSCWDNSNPQPYTTGNQPEELTSLDTILERFVPTITFLQYRQIAPLIKTDSRTENEYYGNSTDYSYKELDLKDLYDFMTTKGWL